MHTVGVVFGRGFAQISAVSKNIAMHEAIVVLSVFEALSRYFAVIKHLAMHTVGVVFGRGFAQISAVSKHIAMHEAIVVLSLVEALLRYLQSANT